MAIKVLPNMMAGSRIYTVTTNEVQQKYANPYTGSCSGLGNCGSYGAVVRCLISIYQGVGACQTIYLIDKEGNLIDTDRLDYAVVTVRNIYGCTAAVFDSRLLTDGAISFPQVKYDGEIFSITPENFNEVMFGDGTPMFDVDEDSIYLHDGEISVVTAGRATPFITAPVEYREKITVRPEISGAYGSPVLSMRANGAPNVLVPNEDNDILMLTESDDGCILEFGVSCGGTEAGFRLDSMRFTTVAGISGRGEVRICFSPGATANMLPSELTATVMFKFKDDDEAERGSTQVVTCVPIGTVYKNEVPEYENGGSSDGGSSGSGSSGSAKGGGKSPDDNFLEGLRKADEEYNSAKKYTGECRYTTDFIRGRNFWLVEHGLGLKLTVRNGEPYAYGVKVTALDTGGAKLPAEVEFVDADTLIVWLDRETDGKIIIN